jgi:N,N'-diacetyllegionaminate synthase
MIAAEIGINHNGDMNLCHELIRQAAINGADLVKFQLYEPKILFADEPHLIEEAERCQFTHDEFKRVLNWCAEESIEPFFSVFDETRLEWTEKENIGLYKLASRSVRKTPEFCKTIADLGKTVYTSLGMSSLEYGRELLGSYENVKFLYCKSLYPAEYSDYADQPKDYAESGFFGISDHTYGIETSLVALARGANFVEKHFTLSKTMEGSDHKCSITPDELKDLVKYGKQIRKVINIEKKFKT